MEINSRNILNFSWRCK